MSGNAIQTFHLLLPPIVAFFIFYNIASDRARTGISITLGWILIVGAGQIIYGGCPLTVWANELASGEGGPRYNSLHAWLVGQVGWYIAMLLHLSLNIGALILGIASGVATYKRKKKLSQK